MAVCYIIGALQDACVPAVKPGDFVIAADGGYARLGGLRPDLVVGDFDSLGYVPQAETIVRHPVRKDDTDTMLAVKLGLERGFRRFTILGGMGGRLDHTVANFQVLAYLAHHGAAGCLWGERECAALLPPGQATFRAEAQGTLSVFAFGGTARGVYLTGLSYPLADAVLRCDFPLGVSNAFTGETAGVSVREGELLLLWSGGPDDLIQIETQ